MLEKEYLKYRLRLLVEKRLALNYLVRSKNRKGINLSQDALAAISRYQDSSNIIPDCHLQQWYKKRLIHIEDALNRIISRSYGQCLRCSQEISIERLNVDPTVMHCYNCKLMTEKEAYCVPH